MCLEDTNRALKNVRNVFMAFNCNIDNIVKVRNQDFPEDIEKGILYSMRYGASESVMSKETEDSLKRIRPDEQRMGGQIGIMANFLAMLGLRPIVYTPLHSTQQNKLFSKGIRLIGPKNMKDKKINWIFEFEKGQIFHRVKARTTNRFIAASRPDKFRMKPIKLPDKYDCAILSGFHGIKPRYRDGRTHSDQFKIAARMIEKIKRKKKPIHLEIAYTKNKKIMNGILRLAKSVDSIGLDVPELVNILNSTGDKGLARAIHTTRDVRYVYDGLKKMQKRIKTKKIHIHAYGYYIALAKEDYHIKPTEIRKSMRFASIVAAAKAGHGLKSKNGIKKGLNYPVSGIGEKSGRILREHLRRRGIEMEDGIARDKDYVIFVPIPLVKRVKGTVGLGDIISSSIFTAEVGYSLE